MACRPEKIIQIEKYVESSWGVGRSSVHSQKICRSMQELSSNAVCLAETLRRIPTADLVLYSS